MKKRLIAAIAALCIVATLAPRLESPAASVGAVYFTGVNSALLPLSEDTMPVYAGVLIYVPYKVFSYAGVHGADSLEDGALYLYRGGSSTRYVDFYVHTGETVGMDNHVYEDVTARIINGTFYVPLDFVCSYFGIRYNVINCEPAPVIRIKSQDDNEILNDNTFVGIFKERMYSDYNAITASIITQSPDVVQPSAGSKPPSYEDVTIYLSFYSLADGNASGVLDTLAPGYRCCFFVTDEDILSDPGLIRRIAGGGHTIGLWLIDGTYGEYLSVSALLFEAARLKTVLISSGNAQETESMAAENGLVFWPASRSYNADEVSGTSTMAKLPTAAGTRHNLLFACTENVTDLLSEMLDALRQGGYNVARITETTAPV